MKTLIVSAAAIAAAALFAPTPSHAQIGFGVPGFGVQIGGGPYGYGGGPYYGGYGYQEPFYGGYRPYGYGEPVMVQPRVYSDYDEPVVRRRVYRQRYVSMPGCRTVTIQRPDGAMRRIRRCS
jgi:hypothetical protein